MLLLFVTFSSLCWDLWISVLLLFQVWFSRSLGCGCLGTQWVQRASRVVHLSCLSSSSLFCRLDCGSSALIPFLRRTSCRVIGALISSVLHGWFQCRFREFEFGVAAKLGVSPFHKFPWWRSLWFLSSSSGLWLSDYGQWPFSSIFLLWMMGSNFASLGVGHSGFPFVAGLTFLVGV